MDTNPVVRISTVQFANGGLADLQFECLREHDAKKSDDADSPAKASEHIEELRIGILK